MQMGSPKVLILDDDPAHLEICALLLQQGGYESLPALVKFFDTRIPATVPVGLVLLDYRLNSAKTSPEFALEIRALYPAVPIIILSDLWAMPADIAPYVNAFVRKGDPAKLLDAVARWFPAPSDLGIQ